MSDIAKEIYTQFKKQELLGVAKELEISIQGNENTRALSAIILKDLEENGIPEDILSVSDIMFELLVTAEYIDEDGNLLEENAETAVEEVPAEAAEVVEQEIPDWICFSYADPRDPACNKCNLYDACWIRRIELRPACFGKEYNAGHPECQACLEAPYCKTQKEKENG
jgi:hypothetical protein